MPQACTSIFLFTAYPLWSETFIRQDLAFLQKAACPVIGAALYSGDCTPEADWPDVTVLTPGAAPSSTISRRKSRLRELLLKLLPAKLFTALSLWKHRALVKRLTAFARDHHATHIHAEFADLAALVASRAARNLGITYSVGIHAFDIHACKFDLAALLCNARAIAVCNQAALDACRQRLPQTASLLHLIYHGVNLDAWHFNPPSSSPSSSVLDILFIGRLVPKKGISILLDAMALFAQLPGAPRVRLTLAGTGPLEDTLRRQADSLSLDTRWLGRQSPEQLRALLPTMTCLCAPSIVTPDGDRDGIPNVILEAMASGVPVVASQVGSIGEVVTPETGWPIDTLTPQTLSETLLALWNCPDRASRIIRARKLIEDSFDARKLAETRQKILMQ